MYITHWLTALWWVQGARMSNRSRPKTHRLCHSLLPARSTPTPKLRTIIHPDGSCRNADILEKKGINSWDGMSRAGDSWPERYICGQMETISHIAQQRAARVRPGERDAQTADDGPGSFCLPYTFSLCSGIPKRYRQIRGTGCSPNLHLFTQGWAGKCLKSNSNTVAAKPPEPLGCVTRFTCG